MPDFRWSPIADYSPTFWEWETRARSSYEDFATCEVNGEQAWTDGHMLCLGPPPGPIRDSPIAMAHTDRLIKETNRLMYELNPLVVIDIAERPIVIFESGQAIQAKFFNVVREKWPAVRFFASDDREKPVVARIPITRTITSPSEMSAAALDAGTPSEQVESQKLVALIMQMRTDDWKDRIAEVLALMKESDERRPNHARNTTEHAT